jgi:hypothetical protein
MFLVRQEPVQRFFVKFIFGRRSKPINIRGMPANLFIHESQSFISDSNTAIAAGGDEEQLAAAVGLQLARMQQPVKVIHKEHEAVTAFCINKVSSGLMAISTQKELQELDVSLLLNPNTWQEGMTDEADFDVLNLNEYDFEKVAKSCIILTIQSRLFTTRDPETLPASNYLVIQTPGDPNHGGGLGGSTAVSQLNSPSGQPPPFGPSGGAASHQKGSTVVSLVTIKNWNYYSSKKVSSFYWDFF